MENKNKSKEKKKNSFLRTIVIASVIYLLLMAVILSTVWANTAATLENSAAAALEQAGEITVREMDEVLKANEQALSMVLQSNDDIAAFERGDDIARAKAAQNMLQTLSNVSRAGEDVRTLFFYDLIGNTYIARPYSDMSYNDTVKLEEWLKELKVLNGGNMPPAWFYKEIGEKKYVVRVYKNKKRMLGAVVSVADIIDKVVSYDAISYSITDDNSGAVIAERGDSLIPSEELTKAKSTASWIGGRKYYALRKDSERGDFSLVAAMTGSRVYGGFQTMQVIILCLIVAAILMLLLLALYTRKVMYRPFTGLLKAMNDIENGDYEQRLSEDADTDEFTRINTSFNRMVNTIVNLRMRSYEERIQFDEATLKYVQLQIKPHFFLNALTTIHSMSLQNRGEDIREYIERLSRNVRYLFKSGLHTVPLSEEIEHARDYIAMQEILYPGCVFDFIDVEESVTDYPVPQLLIHTILENIYKHAVSVDSVTSILITCKKEGSGEEEMCHIVIEDDGPGYPEEFLTRLEGTEVKLKENGHGLGLWNLKKTLSLMYRKDDLIRFSNKDTKGSRVDIYIPRRVKRQSSVWKQS
ncbi:MAG: histidine kinase [Butyrivibrio sp.]|nr:histidine kinase [Butyrivibrio sp.]